MRKVVVTGIGLITPLGNNVKQSWQSIIEGKSGISRISHFDPSEFTCKVAAEVKDFTAEDYINPKDARRMDPFIHYGIAAAVEAVEDAGWQPEQEESLMRTGVMIGSGIGGLQAIENSTLDLHMRNKKVSPFFIPSCLINMISGHVSMKYGFMGPNHSVVTACGTGTHAIGDAANLIRNDYADVIIAGGAEAAICPVGVAGFAAARALSTKYNDTPEKSSRPWDQGHDGFVMGEGAGVLVLEEYEHAKARGATIYGEVAGYGLSGDAHHITAPHPEGLGAKSAIKQAMKFANIQTNDIDYINAHGTSTQVGDSMELKVAQDLFLDDNPKVAMSSTKSMTGHLLGGAGGIEAAFSLLAMRDQVAPPTINLENPLEEVRMNLVPNQAQEMSINTVLSNSLGFGGVNCSLLFKKI